jgi:cobalt-zinc-cadmium efflux system outer membrane protein
LTHPRARLARVYHAGSNGLEQPPAIRFIELHLPQIISTLSMSISKYFLISIILLAQGIRAEPSLVLTLDSLANRIHRQNPDLAAARVRIQEALGRVKQAGRLANPELQFSAEHNNSFNEGRVELGFSQRFPVTDRLRREKSLSLTNVTIAETEVLEFERQLVAQARTALFEVLAIRERRSLLKAQVKLNDELVETIRQAAARGEGSLLEAGQAGIESARVAAELRQLDAREAGLVGSLKPLLGMVPDQGLVVTGKLPPMIIPPEIGTLARPDLQTAKLEIGAAAQSVELEKSRRFGDVEAGVFTAAERTEDVPIGRKSEGLLGFQLKIPLPWWNKNEGGIEEAEALHQRRQLEHRALARNINLEVEAARAEMREWAALAGDITNRLLPLADKQAADTESAWRNGQAEFQAVLRARDQRLELAATRIDALREYHLASARHQAAIGKP